MKSFLVLSTFSIALLSASAAIEVRVCDPNDLRPLGTYEVMMGTSVSLVVHSDANDLWSGGFFIHDEHRGRGMLKSRETDDPNAPAGSASCLEAAGEGAFIMAWNDSLMSGFDLYTDDFTRVPGNWFVLDYIPLAEGECTIHYYDHERAFTTADPNLQIAFWNSATRDLDGSGVVDLGDWAVFASQWMAAGCAAPDWCAGADLDRDGEVGLIDLAMFADFWLWGTPNWQTSMGEPTAEPRDPNVFYAILDPNGLSEAWIPVGQSIRLYLDKTTLGKNVYIISLEVTTSDPNLGWIDNTPYDPNNPFGGGTAELLATPRWDVFDYWGPGYTQQEGIRFLAINLNGAIQDGLVASFVYTPTATGTVTLGLVTHIEGVPAALNPIRLHQYDPGEMMMSGNNASLTQERVEKIAKSLEELWDESSAVQQTFEEEKWFEFVDVVRTSAQSKTLD